jgi:hypothetical protein
MIGMRAVVLGALLAATITTAAAQDVSGSYQVQGTNFDGSPYSGTAEITATSESTCRIEWDTGSISSGICMVNQNAFAAGYVLGDVVGLVIYEIMPDGSMHGTWTIADSPGVGTETLIPVP